MEDVLGEMALAWWDKGVGVELPHVPPRPGFVDPWPPPHTTETRDRLTHDTWPDDLLIIAKDEARDCGHGAV